LSLLRIVTGEKDSVKVSAAINQTAEYVDKNVRAKLSSATTLYVRTDGSDTNSGLVNSASGAFLTLQKAYNVIAESYDLGGNTATIQVADGTYANGINFTQPWSGGGSITVQGNLVTPANCLISSSSPIFNITCVLPGIVTLQGIKGTTSGGQFINHNGSGQIQYKTMDFGTCSGPHIVIQAPGAYVQAIGSYTISAGAPAHWRTFFAGVIEAINTFTITLTGTPAFSAAFVDCTNQGAVYVGAAQVTISGAATGKRYSGVVLSNISTNGGGANYFPGNVAGTVDATSVYS
jgi:hypothetical protein